jgi:hypothetical protein
MTAHPDLAALDRLKTRIQGLRSHELLAPSAGPNEVIE